MKIKNTVYVLFLCLIIIGMSSCQRQSNGICNNPRIGYGKTNDTSYTSTNESYVTSGKTEVGMASYYADAFHGKPTANGEKFNMNKLTAAHKTLPFNTRLKVTNLSNGKSVVVRVNDRGPFVSGRIIDLSYAAAKKIDMIKSGVAKVKIEVVK